MDQPGYRSSTDWRGRIGVIYPTISSYRHEIHQLVPDGVDVFGTNLGIQTVSESEVETARSKRSQAAEFLAGYDVECIIAVGAPISAIGGAEAEANEIAEIQAEVGIPVSTALDSQVDALTALGAENIAVITPFDQDRDSEYSDYLERNDFSVVTIQGPDIPDVIDLYNLSDYAAYHHLKSLDASDVSGYDAVLIPCSPFGNVRLIPQMERDIGCPVVMSAQAIVWKALRLIGLSQSEIRCGELFSTS